MILPPEAGGLSLSPFPRLEEFIGSWDAHLDLSGCKALKRLHIRGYKAKCGDLRDIPNIPSLLELGLVQSSLTSLAGISRFHALKRLGLSHSLWSPGSVSSEHLL